MKDIRIILLTILSLSLLTSFSLFLTSCEWSDAPPRQTPTESSSEDDSPSQDADNEFRQAYETYVKYTQEKEPTTPLSYEQWLLSIRGDKGEQGDKGEDGVGIEKVAFDDDGNLVFTFTDGTTQTVIMPKGDVHVHTFRDWTSFTSDDTYCENRLFFRVCSACKSIEWEQGTYSDHEWDIVTTVPTSQTRGYDTKTCSICGKVEIDNYTEIDPSNPIIAEIQYNPGFGSTFKDDYPIESLPLRDNMPVAPYAYSDLTLFSGKRITKIDVPVGTVKTVDENQYFTIHVVKKNTVKVGGVYTDGKHTSYKVYIPKEELTSTTVNKWISVDLSDQFIYVGEDETLAFMSPTDPVVCCYAGTSKHNFIYDLGKAGRQQTTQTIFYGVYTDDLPDLRGKNFSILGDSISTFADISNNSADTNSTIGNNAIFYPKYEIDKADETWWLQSANATGMNLLVNNSWSGSRVLNNNGAAYQTRCNELHGDIGSNKGVNPDLIAVYIGINDFNGGNTIGSFNSVDEIYTEESGYIVPQNVAQAYAIMVHKMTKAYGDADIFLFTLPANGANKDTDTLAKYNEVIKGIAKCFGCYVVDVGNIDGYDYEKYTSDGLHPNELGMDLITDLFVRMLKGVYVPKE